MPFAALDYAGVVAVVLIVGLVGDRKHPLNFCTSSTDKTEGSTTFITFGFLPAFALCIAFLGL